MRHNKSRGRRSAASSAGQPPIQQINAAEVNQLLNQGADLLQQGQATQALSFLQRARELDATNIAVTINLGGAYILLGRHKDAIPLLEEAAAVEANNGMVWMNLGAAYLGNPILSTVEKQERAMEAFRRALALHPDMPNVNYNLGLILRDQGNWAAAREEFRRALEVNPADRDAQMLLDQMTDLQSTDSS